MKKILAIALFLFFAIQQNVFAFEGSYIVTKDNPVFRFDITSPGYEDEGDVLTTRTLSENELYALLSAGEKWAEILGVTPVRPAKIYIYADEELNASASSDYAEIGQEFRKTVLNVALNYDTAERSFPDAHIFVGKGLIYGHEGWETFVEPYAVFNSDLPDLYSTMVHEIYHALGMMSGASGNELYGYRFCFNGEDKLTIWDSYLRIGEVDSQASTFTEVSAVKYYDPINMYEQEIITNQVDSDNAYGGNVELRGDLFDIYNFAPYFVGSETMKVLAGIDGTVEECQEEIIKAGGLLNYSQSYEDPMIVYGLPINGAENGSPELSHIELRNSFMSHQAYQNWGILMEAELAVLKDLGYNNVELRDYFGKSYYLNNIVDTWTGYNDGIGYGHWNGSGYNNSPSAITNGIGMHIYGDKNDITQEANILSNGLATIGVRIDGVENTYTLADGFKIETTGRNSIGLATMWGKNHVINLEENSIIDASGENGIGLSFDFGKNVMGGYNDHRGSYIAWSSAPKSYYIDPETGEAVITEVVGDDMALPDDLDGELVTELNIAGTVKGDKAAIYISDNAYVKDINILGNSKIEGDLISNWNSQESGPNKAQVESGSILATNLNFINDTDKTYNGFNGNIISQDYNGENALKVNFKKGDIEYNGNIIAKSVSVMPDSGDEVSLSSSGKFLLHEFDINDNFTAKDKFEVVAKTIYNRNNGEIDLNTGSKIFADKFFNRSVLNLGSDSYILVNNNFYNDDGEINVNGDFTLFNNIQLASAINDGTLNLNSGTLTLANNVNSIMSYMVFNGGNLNMINNTIQELELDGIELVKSGNVSLDIDLKTQTMDTFKFDSDPDSILIVDPNSILSLTNINIMNLDANTTAEQYKFDFIKDDLNNEALANNIDLKLSNDIVRAPIYDYKIGASTTDPGSIVMNRQGFSASALASPVAAQVGGFLTQLHSYDMAFGNMDMNMLMSYEDRQAMKFRNKYAMSGVQAGNKLMTFDPNQLPEESRGLWFKPFATFEKVGLDGGPTVENQAYGMFFGGDSEIISLKRGWDAVFSAFAGYTGSHQHYNGVSSFQNGGSMGASGVFYKGNLFTGVTANVGSSVAEASTMFGSEDMTMLMSGIASKTGYNWELFNNKFIIQPSFMMSYSFVNTFDYKNAAGVNIEADPLHAIQLVPGMKFIGNLKNGWQPYFTIQMVWNLMDDAKFRANNVALPQMSVDPYVQYGVGLQKRWGERFAGFGQTLIRNGGRNGVALTLGFRWAIGKDSTQKEDKTPKISELKKTKVSLNCVK